MGLTSLYGADEPEVVPEAPPPATEASVKVQGLVSAWDSSKEQTTETAQKLLQDLVAVGAAGIPGLIQALESSVAKQSLATGTILVALMRLKAKPATPVLAKLFLAAEDRGTKRNILTALKAIGTAEAIPALMKAFNAPLPDRNNPKISRDELGALSDLAEQTSLTLRKLGETSEGAALLVQELSKNFFTAAEPLKLRYILILQEIQYRVAEQFLLNLLSDPSATIRVAALAGLGFNGTKSAALVILPQLRSPDIRVKAAAATALGRLKFVRAIPDLLPLLSAKEPEVSSGALYALRNMTGMQFTPDPERWQVWYDDEKAASQARVAVLLQQIKSGPPELAPVFVEQLADCLLQQDKLSAELQGLVQHTNFRVRAAACNVLAQIGDLPALQLLVQRLLDPALEVAAAAYRGLKYATGLQLQMDYESWRQALDKRG